MRDPVALFEIYGVQRPAPAAPVIAAAAQEAQPPLFQRGILHAAFGARVHLLDTGIETHAAGFQQQHVQLGVGQRQRQRNAGRAAAHNGDVTCQHLAVGKRAGVDQGGQGGNPAGRGGNLKCL